MSVQIVPMRKIVNCIVPATLVFLLTMGSATAAELSKEFQSDILKLLKMTGAEAIGLQMGVAVSNQAIDNLAKEETDIPPKAVDIIKEEINKIYAEEMPSLMAQIVPVYAKHFTPEEVKGLIAFYATPLGQKSIKEMPTLLNECMQVGRAWGEGLTPKVLPRLEERLKQEGLDK
ncbi:MAG TPA: DUF2059 domain-containing protein [Geobacteraceae bacterium]